MNSIASILDRQPALVIDGALANMLSRELVSTGEVADLLLDVRTLLTTDVGSTAETTPLSSMPVIDSIEPVATESV